MELLEQALRVLGSVLGAPSRGLRTDDKATVRSEFEKQLVPGWELQKLFRRDQHQTQPAVHHRLRALLRYLSAKNKIA